MRKIALIFALVVLFFAVAPRAHADTDFHDFDCNEGTVVGNANFYDGSCNNGIVTGNATFYSSDVDGLLEAENYGTVNGQKIRRYIDNLDVFRDFVTSGDPITEGPWHIIADGAVVNIISATIDETTTFETLDGGSFVYLLVAGASAVHNKVTLSYNHDLDEDSVPDAEDFIFTLNGDIVPVTGVEVSGLRVILTVDETMKFGDEMSIDYVVGDTSITSIGIPAPAFSDRLVIYGIAAGLQPYTATLSGTKLYVVNSARDSVAIIDTMTDEVIKRIAVGDSPEYSLYSALHHKVYINNKLGDTVSVINTDTDTVTATIPVGHNPIFSVPAGDKIYVANLGTSTVSVIDTSTDTVVATRAVVVGPYSMQVKGGEVFVTNGVNVSVINTTTNTVVRTIAVGAEPVYDMQYGGKAYVVNQDDDEVLVVDPDTDAVLDTINVGNAPVYLAIYEDKVFVTNGGGSSGTTVSVIDADTDTVVDTITVGNYPYDIKVVGGKIYVMSASYSTVAIIDPNAIPSALPGLTSFTTSASSGTYESGDTINITAHFNRETHSGSTMTVALNSGGTAVLNNVSGSTLYGTYTVGASDATPDLAVSSVTSASVTDMDSHTRTSYSLTSSQGDFNGENSFIVRNIGDSKNITIGSYLTIDTGDNPYQVSVPINGYIYVANQRDDSVSVIRISDNTVVDTIDVGSEPYGLATATVDSVVYLYVANIDSDNVSVIDTSSNSVIATVTVGTHPYYVASIGTKVYVTNGFSNTVSVIDANTNTVSATVVVGSYPRGIKAHGTDVYVANYGDANFSGGNYISVINSLNNTVTARIFLPGGSLGPRGMTVLGDNVYVANFRSNNVSVINANTNTITDTIDVGMGPRGIVGLGTNVYVENFDGGTISVIDTNTNTVTDTVVVGHSPAGMGISGTDIYLSSFQDNRLYILNTLDNTLTPGPVEEEEEVVEEHHNTHGSTTVNPNVAAPVIVQDNFPQVPVVPHYQFLRTLVIGDTGEDVRALQKYLNTNGFVLTPSGLGSPGYETSFFGLLTKAALIKFQEVHKAEILLPIGLYQGTGIFGPMTKAYINTH